MSQITVNSVISPLPLSAAEQASATADRAHSRDVSAGVRVLNNAGYAGEGREFTFSVDPVTKAPVIRVIDSSTNEVIQQWPSEYLLLVAAEAANGKGDAA